MKSVLVTGCAGFIGSNLVDRLLSEGMSVVGVDNLDNYYSRDQKGSNLNQALKSERFKFCEVDILDKTSLEAIFKKEEPTKVVHLAARPGVRPSLINPLFYAKNNIEGTVNLLKLSVDFKVGRFVFASSSSVYGKSKKIPFEENDKTEFMVSPYGASKRAGEFFVESIYRSFGLKSIIFRFFTVYGKRGRPDMAPYLFSKAIMRDEEVRVFGDGTSWRDYTFIDDIIDAVKKGLESKIDFAIINLGSNHPVKLNDFIGKIEQLTGRRAKISNIAKQSGDVDKTWASIVKAKKLLGWNPKTELGDGLRYYIKWLNEN